MNIKKKQKIAKSKLLEAFDESETKSVSDITKRAGLARHTFYDYFNQDADFRKKFLRKQKSLISRKIAAG